MESKNKCDMMKAIEHVKTMRVASMVEVAEGRGTLMAPVDLVKIPNDLS